MQADPQRLARPFSGSHSGAVALFALLAAGWFGLAAAAQPLAVFPGEQWDHVPGPDPQGWSSAKLEAAHNFAKSIGSAALFVVHQGRVVDDWGQTPQRFKAHSIRKSFLSALYGIPEAAAKICLSDTMGELGIDDNEPGLTVREKEATVADLLKARSGVYHPALYETDAMKKRRPERGSHPPGTYWYYNNWDFNVLGTLAIVVTSCATWAALASTAAEPPFDPATIALPGNLVSNPSFESGRPGRGPPGDWAFYAAPQYSSLATEAALHGRCSVLVDRPPLPGIVHVAARQAVPIVAGQEYTLCAWVKVERSNAGVVSLYLDFLDADRQRLAIKQVSQREVTDGWKKLAVTAVAPFQAAFAQVLVPYVDGDMRVLTDCVSLTSASGGRPDVRGAISDLTASRQSGSSIYLDWKSPLEHHEVDWRAEGQSGWNTIANVWSPFHSVIMLQPQTAYEFKVRGLPPRLIDENGKPAAAAPALESSVLRAATTKLEPKRWEGLQLWPTQHIASFPDQQCYPCIEFYRDAFYVVEARQYGIYLSRLRERDFAVEWTKQLVPPVKPVSCYQGIPDTCIFQDKLWVMWNRQATGDPKYQITDSRQLVLQYDLATGQISEPLTIASTKPGCGTWEGGLTVYQGRLWMMWMEVWLNPAGRRRTQIVLRPYEDGRFTETIVFPCPSEYPYGPSINVFGDRLILLWSDLAAGEQRPDFEPLYCTFFDGKDFSPSVLLHGEGRSRYAKGAQLGDDFYCVYKCNTRYPKSGYMYHDLALTRISADARQVKTTYWVDDVKYNSSPDMIQHDGGLVAVYGKFEHAYGNPRDPALNHGSFIGRIRPDTGSSGN